jgi:hypothetical protein
MSRPSMWINSADYWISSYFILGEFCYNSKPKLLVGSISEFFPLAHSLELYLKGCLECMNSQSPLLKSHKLFEIWKELKTDESFLPNIVIKDEYITSYKFYDNNDFLKLSHKDFFCTPRISHKINEIRYGIKICKFTI